MSADPYQSFLLCKTEVLLSWHKKVFDSLPQIFWNLNDNPESFISGLKNYLHAYSL